MSAVVSESWFARNTLKFLAGWATRCRATACVRRRPQLDVVSDVAAPRYRLPPTRPARNPSRFRAGSASRAQARPFDATPRPPRPAPLPAKPRIGPGRGSRTRIAPPLPDEALGIMTAGGFLRLADYGQLGRLLPSLPHDPAHLCLARKQYA